MDDFINISMAFDKGIIDECQKKLLTEYIERLHMNNVPIIYNLRHLRKLFDIPRVEQNKFFGHERSLLYKTFYIPKKSGGYRKIEAPNEKLEKIQCWIKEKILDNFNVSEYAKGFKKGTNIVDNALPHCSKEVLINIDINNFFPSVKYSSVFRMFNYMGYTKEVCHLLTRLCTNAENVLPQGAPTSPSISNLVNLRLDKRLSTLAISSGAVYTRYADDITFSGDKQILKYIKLIKRIINEEGYSINDKKFRIQFKNQRQVVTGLIVNSGVKANKQIINELNKAIFFIKKYGIQDHMAHEKINFSAYKEHLYGLAYFINMIDRTQGKCYIEQLNSIDWLY